MFVLDKLWRGILSPSELCVNAGSEYDELRRELLKKEQQIAELLTQDGKKLFMEFQELQTRMASISEEDVFINGFRIGVGMLLDSIGTYESQFVRYHEE